MPAKSALPMIANLLSRCPKAGAHLQDCIKSPLPGLVNGHAGRSGGPGLGTPWGLFGQSGLPRWLLPSLFWHPLALDTSG